MSAIADRPVPLADRAGGSGLRRLDRITAYAPPGLLLIASFAVGAARLAGAAPGPGVGSVVLVAGLLVGLPHGALDVERVVTGRRGHARALVGCGYVASAAAAFLAWLVRPAAAVVALVVLAWLHFGLTDLTEVVRRGRRSVPAALKVAVVGACGGIPVVVPFVVAADRTRPLLERLSGGSDAILGLASAAVPAVAAAAVLTAGWALAARPGSLLLDVAALAVAFGVLPPLMAFGLYFGGWHALRQSGRLVRERAAAGGPLGGAVAALARRAAPPTGGALLLLGLLVGRHGLNLPAADLALLLAVTVPHSVVSVWQDRTDLHDRRVPDPNGAFAGRVGG